MFDSIIKEVNEKYDLGDRAETLVAALLALMTDRASGGLAGFIERFRAVGLGDLADSWISSGANTPVSYEQLESALGEDTLRGLSERAGTDYKMTVTASEYVIPHLIDELTPEGEIPSDDDLHARTGAFASGGVGTSSGGTDQNVDRADAGAATAARMAEDEATAGDDDVLGADVGADENALLGWLLPLIILALLVALGFWFCGGRSEPVATVNANANTANTNTAANAANANAVP